MKKLFLSVILSFFAVSQFACGDSQTSQNAANFGRNTVFPTPEKGYPALTIYLNEYVSAQNRKDYEKIFSLTYPKQIEMEGGRNGFLEKLDAAAKEAKDFSYLAGKPAQVISEDGKMLAVIPISTKRRVPEGWRFSREVLIAVSEDEGKRWTFADVTDREKRQTLFPSAVNKLEIPEIKPPWIEK